MGKSFKELSFAKKTLAVFVIAFGILLFGVAVIFTGAGLSNVFYGAGNMFVSEQIDLAEDYDSGSSFENSYSDSYSKSYSSSTAGGTRAESRSESRAADEVLAKDFSAEIEARDILGTVDSVVELSKSYDAVLDGSRAGNEGYGYVNVKVPADKVEAFVAALRDKFNVVSYDQDARNVSDDFESIDERMTYLQEQLDYYTEELSNVSDDDDSYKLYIREEIDNIKEEMWYLKNNRESINNDVVYSNVYVSVVDKNYTTFHTFDGVWLAVKQGMHAFILCVVYGLYVVLYVFLMVAIVKFLRRFIKNIGGKASNTVKPLAKTTEQSSEQSEE